MSINRKDSFSDRICHFVANEDLFLAQLKEVWILNGQKNKDLFELFFNKYKKQINYFKCRPNKQSEKVFNHLN